MSDFITLSCPSCGGKLNVQKNSPTYVCEYCGTEHKIREEDIEYFGRCPKCHRNDRVEKITAIVNKDDPLAVKFPPPDKLNIERFLKRPDLALKQRLNSLEFSYISEDLPENFYEKRSKKIFFGMAGLLLLGFVFIFLAAGLEIGFLYILGLLSLLGSIVLSIFGVMTSIKGAKEKEKEIKGKRILGEEIFLNNQSVLEKEFMTQKREVNNQKAILRRKLRMRYDKIYYCHRDDLLFIPGEAGYASCNGYEGFLTHISKTDKKA